MLRLGIDVGGSVIYSKSFRFFKDGLWPTMS